MKTQKFWILSALVATLLAIATHAYLTYHSYSLKAGAAKGQSICNINSQFNCDAVSLSSYADVLSVPVALWGLAANVGLLIFILIMMLEMSSDIARVSRANFWLSFLILGSSLVMATISATSLGTYCLFCIGIYVLSVIQAFAGFKLVQGSPLANLRSDFAEGLTGQKWLAVVFILIPAFSFLGNSMARDSFGLKGSERRLEEALYYWQTGLKNDFNLGEGLVFPAGSSDAKMTIVEFADFLCPHCKDAAPGLHAFVENHPGVRLIFKSFPLDGTCNSGMQHKGDGLRCHLAGAVFCADALAQKGWAMHDFIFGEQRSLNLGNWTAKIKEAAEKNGLSTENLMECINSQTSKDLIQRMAAEGLKAQVPGTPSVYVNGQRVDALTYVSDGRLIDQTEKVLETIHKTIQ